MNPLSLNHKSHTNGNEHYHFNCGGFALGSINWYEPENYEEMKFETGWSTSERLNIIAENIEEDYPWLIRLTDFRNIPKRFKVIGFRIEEREDPDDYDEPCDICEFTTCEDGCPPHPKFNNYYPYWGDFHFIMRYRGVWYHKPGPHRIEKLVGDVRDRWSHPSGITYDSEIIWFLDTTAHSWE